MAETKWGKYFITEMKKDLNLPDFRTDKPGQALPPGQKKNVEHVVWLDDEVIPGSTIFAEVAWFWAGPRPHYTPEAVQKGEGGVAEHIHPYDEAICFFGTDLNDPHNLNGEIELWLDGEKHILDKTFIAFVPAGMKHGPVAIHKVDKPIFHFNIGASGKYTGSKTSKFEPKKLQDGKATEKYIVTRLQHPRVEGAWSPPPSVAEKGHGGRILFMDNDVVPGSFYLETVWATPPPPGFRMPQIPPVEEFEKAPIRPHAHDYDEILCFFGTNPDDVHDLGGEVWFWVEREKHIITRSTMVYVPAGVMHCPLMYPRIDRPMFHFTSFPGGKVYVEDKMSK